MSRSATNTTPPAAASRKQKSVRPYPERFRSVLDTGFATLSRVLSHAAASTEDKGLASLGADVDKLAARWKAPLRNLACIEKLESPRRGRAVGPTIEPGAKVYLLGSEYERASILHGQKVASQPVEVIGTAGSWVKVKLQTGGSAAVTSRMLTRDKEKAAQAQADIESDLASAGPL